MSEIHRNHPLHQNKLMIGHFPGFSLHHIASVIVLESISEVIYYLLCIVFSRQHFGRLCLAQMSLLLGPLASVEASCL